MCSCRAPAPSVARGRRVAKGSVRSWPKNDSPGVVAPTGRGSPTQRAPTTVMPGANRYGAATSTSPRWRRRRLISARTVTSCSGVP
ncbi:hypothetical protein ACFPRL_05050 [Pseudoclavibacter helvolus]